MTSDSSNMYHEATSAGQGFVFPDEVWRKQVYPFNAHGAQFPFLEEFQYSKDYRQNFSLATPKHFSQSVSPTKIV